MKKIPLDIIKKTVAINTTYEYVETDEVPQGEIWCIQHYAVENQTGSRGTFRSYKGERNVPLFLDEQTSPGSGSLYKYHQDIYLRPHQKLGFRQASCVAADVLALYATGYRVHSKFIDGEEENG